MINKIRLGLAVLTARSVSGLTKVLKLGSASVLPGAIARRVLPQVLPVLCGQVREGVIFVAGTNGKTTTSLLLRQMLTRAGYKVVHNETGANLVNGLITALLMETGYGGGLNADYAILEVDENILPLVVSSCKPRYILCLNLFRDQLDRYGEVDVISVRFLEAIAGLDETTNVILNADDPSLCYLGQQVSQRVYYFGLNEPNLYLDKMSHAVDSIYCPRCGHGLTYVGVYLSHLGDYSCSKCGFAKSVCSIDSGEWPQILVGVYNKYNSVAAALTASIIGVSNYFITESIKNFQAAFGRAEELEVKGKRVRILLSKNPVGMNETIRVVSDLMRSSSRLYTTLMVLNDRIPDGTDVSWIWDVDLDLLIGLGGTVVVSGDRVYDMALRVRYCESRLDGGCGRLIVREDLNDAIAIAIEETDPNTTLHIIPTYSAMLEVREILTGRKIL